MSKKWRLIVVLLLVLLILIMAGDGGDGAASAERSGVTWMERWAEQVGGVTAPTYMDPPHFICPDPEQC